MKPKRKAKPEDQKIIPAGWKRRAYRLEPQVLRAIEEEAARKRIPVSLVVNRILKNGVERVVRVVVEERPEPEVQRVRVVVRDAADE